MAELVFYDASKLIDTIKFMSFFKTSHCPNLVRQDDIPKKREKNIHIKELFFFQLCQLIFIFIFLIDRSRTESMQTINYHKQF